MKNWYDQPSVAVDLDGTLCPDTRTAEPAAAFPHMVRMTWRWRKAGYWVVLNSSRPASDYPTVADWVRRNDVAIDQIVLGGKPNTEAQVDDRGLLLPAHALDEWVTLKLAADRDPVQQWTEDDPSTRFRVDMENCGENPAGTGDSAAGCSVVVPVTGGLDSATAYAMAVELDMPVRPVYVDTGVDYTEDEINVARGIAPGLHVIDLTVAFPRRYDHILVGRNAVIIWTVAQWAVANPGQYAEIWMGNHGDETKLRAGDKSVRFHATMQHLLTAYGYDVHLCHPLQGLTKTDLVRWWVSRGRLAEALATRTCFTGMHGRGHCGMCWACLQRVLAFGCAGYLTEVLDTMPDVDFTAAAATFWEKDEKRRASGQRTGRDPGVYDVMDRMGYPCNVARDTTHHPMREKATA